MVELIQLISLGSTQLPHFQQRRHWRLVIARVRGFQHGSYPDLDIERILSLAENVAKTYIVY